MPIPGNVMASAMGLGPDAAEEFMRWSWDGSILLRPCSPGMGVGQPEIQEFFRRELRARQADPERPDDLFRLLAESDVLGERLNEQEVVTQLHFMIQAGVHTTRGLLMHLATGLLLHPELVEELRADGTRVARYVEESLRFDPPAATLTRRATRDVELGGEQLEAGDLVAVAISSANRDEALHDAPDEFRLDRPDPKDHLGFGGGPHVCPGATLARLEGVVAVETLLERVDLRPVDGATYPGEPAGLAHHHIPAHLVARG
jgi:cytochrome P450